MTASLFDDPPQPAGPPEVLSPAPWCCGFALAQAADSAGCVQQITAQAPFRHLGDPWRPDHVGGRDQLRRVGLGGVTAAATAMTPSTRRPARPGLPCRCYSFCSWREAAETADFAGLRPTPASSTAMPPARLSLHQDRDEATTPTPSCPWCRWAFRRCFCGGLRRAAADKTRRTALLHGDVVVWADWRACAFMACCPARGTPTR